MHVRKLTPNQHTQWSPNKKKNQDLAVLEFPSQRSRGPKSQLPGIEHTLPYAKTRFPAVRGSTMYEKEVWSLSSFSHLLSILRGSKEWTGKEGTAQAQSLVCANKQVSKPQNQKNRFPSKGHYFLNSTESWWESQSRLTNPQTREDQFQTDRRKHYPRVRVLCRGSSIQALHKKGPRFEPQHCNCLVLVKRKRKAFKTSN